jgi:proteasome lid subunit RPN8/RPN11
MFTLLFSLLTLFLVPRFSDSHEKNGKQEQFKDHRDEQGMNIKESTIPYAIAKPMNHLFVTACVPKMNALAALLHSGWFPNVL